jgi:hypothetical protein
MNIETIHVQNYKDVPQKLKREIHKTYKPSIFANSSSQYNYNASYIHPLKSHPLIFYYIQHTHMSPQITQFRQPLSRAHRNNNSNNPFVNTLAQSKNIHPNLGPWQTLLDTSPPH